MGGAPVGIGVSKVRIELDGFVEIRDGLGQVALNGIGNTTVGVGGGVIWVKLDGFIVVVDGQRKLWLGTLLIEPTQPKIGVKFF